MEPVIAVIMVVVAGTVAVYGPIAAGSWLMRKSRLRDAWRVDPNQLPPRRRMQYARLLFQDSLVLVHGGMAQNVGPILEMVTEKYLLRSEPEWTARAQAGATLDEILALLSAGGEPPGWLSVRPTRR